MTEDNCSISKKTQRFSDDLVDLWRGRRCVSIVEVLIIIAPTCFSLARMQRLA